MGVENWSSHSATPMNDQSKKILSPLEEVQSVDQVVRHVALLIERGQLRPGDRLVPERELAEQLGVSRPTVRAGLHALAAMGAASSSGAPMRRRRTRRGRRASRRT